MVETSECIHKMRKYGSDIRRFGRKVCSCLRMFIKCLTYVYSNEHCGSTPLTSKHATGHKSQPFPQYPIRITYLPNIHLNPSISFCVFQVYTFQEVFQQHFVCILCLAILAICPAHLSLLTFNYPNNKSLLLTT
jgi:hypothetical protein